MNYQTSTYNFTKTGGTWSTATWPSVGNDAKIDFYAYNGGKLNWSETDPYVSFDMGTDAFAQKDLLVADTTAAFSDNSGKVSLMFNHACAAVRFYVRKSVEQSVSITGVELAGVQSKGDYHYASSAWQSLSSPMTYTLTNASIGLTTEKQLLPCGYLFIIPQTKEGLTLKVSYTVNGDEKTHDFNLSGEWKAGHSYVVNVNMGNKVINAQ
ncbi:MAG: fimbrillin family protein [Prevotella sp.]|nr:fimbrillin family protein [Prevotella sp.]